MASTSSLKTTSSLTQLRLEGTYLDDAWFTELKTHSTLTLLDLSNCKLGDPTGTALADALKINSALTQLDMVSAFKFQFSVTSATALAEALTTRAPVHGSPVDTNPTPLKLDLSHNSITDQGAEKILEALKANPSFTGAILQGNSIATLLQQHIIEASTHNTHNSQRRTSSLFVLLLGSPSWDEELLETPHSLPSSSSQ